MCGFSFVCTMVMVITFMVHNVNVIMVMVAVGVVVAMAVAAYMVGDVVVVAASGFEFMSRL